MLHDIVSDLKTVVLYLKGDFDIYSKDKMLEELYEFLEGRDEIFTPIYLLVYLNEVDFIDSAAIGSLIELHKYLKEGGGFIRLLDVPDRLYKIFEITGLIKTLQVRKPQFYIPAKPHDFDWREKRVKKSKELKLKHIDTLKRKKEKAKPKVSRRKK